MVKEHVLPPIIFKDFRGSLQVTTLHEAELNANIVATFLSSATSGLVAISASYAQKSILSSLVLATNTRCLHIILSSSSPKAQRKAKSRSATLSLAKQLLHETVLCNRAYTKLAFDAERIACSLYFDYGIRINVLLDVESLLPATSTRRSIKSLLDLLGGEQKVHKTVVVNAFDRRLRAEKDLETVILRAWATCRISVNGTYATKISAVSSIHTDSMDDKTLVALAKCVRDADQVEALKPMKTKNDVNAKFSSKGGQLNVTLERFTTRLRRGDRQEIVVETSIKGRGAVQSKGTVGHVKGKNARLNLSMAATDAALATIRTVYTIGPEDPTSAELAQIKAILGVLQRTKTFLSHPLARRIYLGDINIATDAFTALTSEIRFNGPLNKAQTKAVQHILSGEAAKSMTIIQGPPGTGKTTVVAASVMSLTANPEFIENHGVWLVAHSNIAVKNMAEKLVEVGFRDFKLLVSHEFHFDWHEHLYGDILAANLIRSDEFKGQYQDTLTKLAGSRVILCSLSMFSSPRIVTSGFSRIVPVNVVIVDEASQIQIGDYLPLFSIFVSTLKKLVFIGDDKQLAPFGQDDLGTLRSIFEMATIRKSAIFLDTQYRMPTPIGDFISRRIYANRLKSHHSVQDRICCKFVDVAHGKETQGGHSYKNIEEANNVARIAKRHNSEGKTYRIITPYDAQRSYIETLLKNEGIPWEGRCFNVDSFQGNEADHIIISVVRTEKIGFLSNRRRSNVMLSRCKRSMIICTNRVFVNGKGSKTLLGEMSAEWGSEAWLSSRDILRGNF